MQIFMRNDFMPILSYKIIIYSQFLINARTETVILTELMKIMHIADSIKQQEVYAWEFCIDRYNVNPRSRLQNPFDRLAVV